MAQRWSHSSSRPSLRHDMSTSVTLSYRERTDVLSWGKVVRQPQLVASPRFADELPALILDSGSKTKLAVGLRRSYGDSCLNGAGVLIDMRGLDRFVSFDSVTGRLRAQAGNHPVGHSSHRHAKGLVSSDDARHTLRHARRRNRERCAWKEPSPRRQHGQSRRRSRSPARRRRAADDRPHTVSGNVWRDDRWARLDRNHRMGGIAARQDRQRLSRCRGCSIRRSRCLLGARPGKRRALRAYGRVDRLHGARRQRWAGRVLPCELVGRRRLFRAL